MSGDNYPQNIAFSQHIPTQNDVVTTTNFRNIMSGAGKKEKIKREVFQETSSETVSNSNAAIFGNITIGKQSTGSYNQTNRIKRKHTAKKGDKKENVNEMQQKWKKNLGVTEMIELQLISEFCSPGSYTYVIIGSAQNIENIINYQSMKKVMTESVYIDYDNDKDIYSIMASLQDVRKEDNKKLLYLVVGGNRNNTNVIRKLRAADTKGKIVTILRDEVDLADFKDAELYDVYLMIPTGSDHLYVLHEICRFCDSGKDQMVRINSWGPQSGFLHELKLFPSFKNNYFKTTFSVYFHFHFREDRKRAEQQQTLCKLINATCKNYILRGSPNPIYHLYHRYTDMVVEYSILPLYKYGIANSPCIGMQHVVLITNKPPTGLTLSGIMEVFEDITWALIASSFLVSGVALYVLRRKIAQQASLVDSFWNITQITLWDCIPSHSHHFSINILLTGYMLGIMMIITLYFGEFTSYITKPEDLFPPIDTKQQLLASNRKVLVYGTWGERYSGLLGIEHNSTSYHERFEQIPSTFPDKSYEAMRRINTFPHNNAFFMRKSYAQKYIQTYFADKHGNDNFHISKTTFGARCTIWPIRVSYYEEAVVRAMRTMHATGMFLHIGRKHHTKWTVKSIITESRNRPLVPQPSNLVTLDNGFGAAIAIYITGVVCSVAALGLEFLCKRYESHIKSLFKKVQKTFGLDQGDR